MKAFRKPIVLLFAAALGALAGCNSDSPTEPRPPGPTNPVPPAPVVSFVVTVTASPTQIAAGTNTSSNVVVRVRRTDNGQPPPDGTEVTLTTTLGEFGVTGSGQQQVTLQLVNGEARAVLFPGTAAGTATVRAQFGSVSGAANVQIGAASTFFVSSISPGVGDPQGGEVVNIVGGGFDPPVRVTFNGATATVRSVTPTRITVVVPSAAAAGVQVPVGQTVPVTVSVTINLNEVGTATDTLQNGFVYSLSNTTQPQIFSVTPTIGSNDGGTEVTINGQGFESPVQVFLERTGIGVEAEVRSVTPTRIVIVTPPARGFAQELRNQPVDVRVRNLNTGFETVRAGGFRYGSSVLVTSFGPGQVPYNTPTSVTIFGQGFDEPVAVSIGGVAATVLSTTGTEIVVRTPVVQIDDCDDVTGPVVVTNIETGDSDSSENDFIFDVPSPVINNLIPATGGEAGGTSIVITGFGFEPPVRVLFGDQAGSVTASSPGSITVLSPRFTGTFPTEACDDNGDGTPGVRNRPTSVDIEVINLGSSCEDSFARAFTYIPANATCRNDNAPAPAPEPQCSDGVDNDLDGQTDFPADPQCTSAADNSEAA